MQTRLTEQFNIRYPLLCAPMALTTGGRLAAAVSQAGGLGIIGGGYAGILGGEPDLPQQLAYVQGLQFGIGFNTWALERVPHRLEQVLAYRPSCVYLSFGNPNQFSEQIHRSGARLICQVQTLRHVEQALEAGAAVIVAQGTEAGGHGGKRATLPFVPEVADLLAKRSPDTLLLAAGGIADGRGLAAALMLGADGVVVGTRFWSSAEALTPLAMTDRGRAATGDDTVRTQAIDSLRGLPWPDEFSYRVLKNHLTEQWADRESEAATAFGTLASAYAEARSREDLAIVACVAGECIGIIDDRPAADTIVQTIMAQAQSVLNRAARGDFR